MSNQNLLAAEAQFRQARAVVGSARAALFPQVAVGVSFARSHQSGTLHNNLGGSGTDVSDYAMPLSINWELDLWGRIAATSSPTRPAPRRRPRTSMARLSL